MIQDITAIYHNEYIEQSPNAGDYIMFVKGRNVLIKKNTEEIEFLRYEELDEVEMAFRYLFALDTEEGRKRFFLGEADLLMEDMLKEYSSYDNKLFACEFENGKREAISLTDGNVALVVGSEGGFSDKESQMAMDLNYKSISLGKRILRAETACTAVTSVVMFLAGELK